MNRLATFPLALLLGLFFSSLNAQTNPQLNCLADEAQQALFSAQPEIYFRQQAIDDAVLIKTTHGGGPESGMLLPHVLPVVVHIVHQNGMENITDARVFAAIDHLNQAYAHEGWYAQQGPGVNTQVQFCLAKRDPDGMATNGITRTVSPLTDMTMETDDIALKDLNRWEPTQYINVWVVSSITSAATGPGVVGYAYFPSSHGNPEDGIVIEAGIFGIDPAQDAVLVHEMGHYLNLYHTFQSGCPNDDCLQEGDQVCDTPPDQATHTACVNNSCSTDADDNSANNPFASDQNDPTENYMDYSPFECYHAFSNGQVVRMQAAIEMARVSLLGSLACSDPCTIPISASLTASATVAPVGTSINLTSNSSGAASLEWCVDGVPVSTSNNFSLPLTAIGQYHIVLKTYNSDPNCFDTAQVFVSSECNITPNFTLNSTSLTVGQTLTAQNTTLGATNYEWYLNGVLVGSATNLSYLLNNAGIYTLTLVAVNSFCTASVQAMVTVADLPCPAPCQEDCFNEIDDDQDGYVDCFDPDCSCSNGSDCSIPLPNADFMAQIGWRSNVQQANVLAAPVVANLDPQNDDMPEILIIEGGNNASLPPPDKFLIYKGDGSNMDSPDEVPVPAGLNSAPAAQLAIADLTGDGRPEVILVNYVNKVLIFTDYVPGANPAMTLLATSLQTGLNKQSYPAVADFDGDGSPEIYVGASIFKLNGNVLTKVLSGTGQQGFLGGHTFIGFGTTNTTAADILSVNDCGGDTDCDGLELIAGANIYSIDLDPSDGDGLEIKIKRDLNIMSPNMGFQDGYSVVADMNLDGFLDVVVAGRVGVTRSMYVYDKNGLLATMAYPSQTQETNVGIPCIANVWDDTQSGFAQDFPEIIGVNSQFLNCFNLNKAAQTPASPAWWNLGTSDGSGWTGATVFDFNGDGISEIVYRDQSNLRIMYGGPTPFPIGVDGQRNWSVIPCNSHTYGEYPIVADVDGDTHAEIVFAGYMPNYNNFTDTKSRLWVLESASSQPWMSARQVWNQFNYFGVNINDDLSVPQHQQLHQLEFPALGSGFRPFNQYLSQLPLFDENFNPYLPAPDAAVTVDSFRCDGGTVKVWLKVCNAGDNILPSLTSLAFYQGDPRTTNATPLGPAIPLGLEVGADSCRQVVVSIPGIYNTPVFVVVNDDFSVPTPYDPATDFPTGEIVECDYDNNFDDFTLDFQTSPPDLGPDLELCNSSIVTLNAGAGYSNYRWQDGSQDSIFTAWNAGKYWVDVTDKCGFTHSDTVQITLDAAANFDLGPDANFCKGDSITLSVTGFDNVVWSPATGLNCTNCPTVTASPTDTVTYYATASTGDCFATDSIKIFVSEIDLQLDVVQGDCSNPATLTATPFGTLTFLLEWSNGESTNTISVFLSGTYAVTLTDGLGCEATATADVTAGNLAVASQLLPPLCDGDENGSIDLTPMSGVPPFTFLWSNNAMTEDLENLPPGPYDVTVTDATGCSAVLSFILETPLPLGVDLQGDTTGTAGQLLVLQAIVTPSAGAVQQIIWQPASFFSPPFDLSETVTLTETTTFTIQITDGNGCLAEDALTVFVIDKRQVYFPNVIFPESQNTGNQGFTAFAGDEVTAVRKLTIFNRWGGIVFVGENFSPNDASLGWDGTVKGKQANPGVFVYVAEVVFSDGSTEMFTGDFTVLR